jgi:hypothetical protein
MIYHAPALGFLFRSECSPSAVYCSQFVEPDLFACRTVSVISLAVLKARCAPFDFDAFKHSWLGKRRRLAAILA